MLNERLLRDVLERQRDFEPIDEKLQHEIMMIPQINLDLQRLPKWLDKNRGVKEGDKVSRLMKGFDSIYEERRGRSAHSDRPKGIKHGDQASQDFFLPERYSAGSSGSLSLPPNA